MRVVEIATAQDVGKAMNPQALEGQIEGGIAQGLGLALMEEIQVVDGKVLQRVVHRLPAADDPRHAAGAASRCSSSPTRRRRTACKGVGEPPNISTPPAIAAALRAATGRALPRVPVRPEHLVGLDPEEAFVARYGALFEHSPWVARAAWARGPVHRRRRPPRRARGRRARGAARAPARAHPRPPRARRARGAGRRADRRRPRASRRRPACDRLTATELERWRALNARLSRALRLPARRLRARAHEGLDPGAGARSAWATTLEEEVEIALGEIAKIARLRLEELDT